MKTLVNSLSQKFRPKSFFDVDKNVIGLLAMEESDLIIDLCNTGYQINNETIAFHVLPNNQKIWKYIYARKDGSYQDFFNIFLPKIMSGYFSFNDSYASLIAPKLLATKSYELAHFILKHHPELIKIDDEKIFEFIEINKKIKSLNSSWYQTEERIKVGESLNLAEKVLTELYNQKKNHIFQQLKKSVSVDFVENVTQNALTSAKEHLNINPALPEKTKETLQSLDEVYNELIVLHLDETIKFNVENLYHKRIVEILEKYIQMPDEYKNSFKDSNGKTANELMQEGLEKIQNLFISTLEHEKQKICQNGISDLRIKNNYLKSFGPRL